MKINKLNLFEIVTILFAIMISVQVNAQGRAPRIISPEVHPDQTVTFRIRATEAKNVTLVMNDAGIINEPLQKDESGVWSITTGPLEPDIYWYYFMVDGVHTVDATNNELKRGRDAMTNLIEVQGKQPMYFSQQPGPYGIVHTQWYDSKTTGTTRSIYVYTPPGYDPTSENKYPVLYLLHGIGDNEAGWTEIGKANRIADNLLAKGKIKPMVIVMPLGHASFPGNDSSTRGFNQTGTAFEMDLLEEVIPLVEKTYHVSTDKKNRAIAGLSMGGRQTLNIGLSHPDKFSHILAYSSAVFNMEQDSVIKQLTSDPAKINNDLNVFWIGCGTDDGLYAGNQDLSNILKEKGIKHTFFSTGGGHSWPVWRLYLFETLPLLFK